MNQIQSESLIPLPQEQFGTLRAFVPDTPWTTSPLHVLEKRVGRAYVDSPESPRNLVIVVPADPDAALPEQAWLFGLPTAHALREYIEGSSRPTDFVCDEDLAPLIEEQIPDAASTDHSVHWFEKLENDEFDLERVDGLRRLRLSDAGCLATLEFPGILRTFESAKDLLMAGGGYGVVVDDQVVCAAVTVDLSVNYARIAVATAPDHRRKGLGLAAAKRLISAHHDQGRLACAVVSGREEAGELLAKKIGFAKAARLRTYRAEPTDDV